MTVCSDTEKMHLSIFNLTVKIGVLEKLVEKLMDAARDAGVATKTADKALAMAQEALVVVTSAGKGGDFGQAAQEEELPPIMPQVNPWEEQMKANLANKPVGDKKPEVAPTDGKTSLTDFMDVNEAELI